MFLDNWTVYLCLTELFEIEMFYSYINRFDIKLPKKVDMPWNPSNQSTNVLMLNWIVWNRSVFDIETALL